MTVRDLIDKVNLSPLLKTAVRSTLGAFAPGSLDSQIGVFIDRNAETIRVDIGGKTALETTFSEIESYVQAPAR